MGQISILWVDDEINLLKPYVLFLEEKGYKLTTINNGNESILLIDQHPFDLVFLDEQMPGLSGIETLEIIKSKKPNLPVIMITKSEEENIMEEAIGSKISDYLIKPVKPNQILLSIKKCIDHKKLVSEKTSSTYQQEFREIGLTLSERPDNIDWHALYKRLVFWELELVGSENTEMENILNMQKEEANSLFAKYVKSNYEDWIQKPDNDTPTFSHNIFQRKIAPYIQDNSPLFLIVIDNFRYDQWLSLKPIITEYFNPEQEDLYFSILPTATQYARNALFAGLMPLDIKNKMPKLWIEEHEEGSKNKFEKELLENLLHRLGKNGKMSFNKILNLESGKILSSNMHSLMNNQLNVIVYNFVDMLSHARTDMEIIRELADNDSAYRSLTTSWFKHSPLLDMMKQISNKGCRMIITTDHGSIKVNNPIKVLADKATNTNLRYKTGRNLNYNEKEVFSVKKPEDIHLPKQNLSSTYIFAMKTDFLVYPNNYNHFAKFYGNTFQHGGISLEEMMIPIVVLNPK